MQGKKRARGTRRPLSSAAGSLRPSAGLGKLKQLRILSLANCGLHELPEEFYSLTGLDYLNLRQNILTVQTVDRLMKELKNTSSDIDVSCYYDTPPELMEFRHLLGNAATCYAALKNKETAPEEKPVYRKNLHYCMEKAAERITAGVPRSVYDEIMYYQYCALKSEEFLSAQSFNREECLSALEALKEVESRLALHYENTNRGILANLLWASADLPDTVCAVILEKCPDRELLDAAAGRMQAALAHATGYYRFGAACRTRVDLLIKAGRQEEAFEIVAAQPKDCMRRLPWFAVTGPVFDLAEKLFAGDKQWETLKEEKRKQEIGMFTNRVTRWSVYWTQEEMQEYLTQVNANDCREIFERIPGAWVTRKLMEKGCRYIYDIEHKWLPEDLVLRYVVQQRDCGYLPDWFYTEAAAMANSAQTETPEGVSNGSALYLKYVPVAARTRKVCEAIDFSCRRECVGFVPVYLQKAIFQEEFPG